MDKQTSQNLGGKDVVKSTISPADLLQKERESIILKGIAAEVSSMKFPNFVELDKMLSKFDWEVREKPSIIDIKFRYDSNDFIQYLEHNRKYLINYFDFANEIDIHPENSLDTFLTCQGLIKKLVLCQNIESAYFNNNKEYILIPISDDKIIFRDNMSLYM